MSIGGTTEAGGGPGRSIAQTALKYGFSNQDGKRHNLCCWNVSIQAARASGTTANNVPLPGCHRLPERWLRLRDDVEFCLTDFLDLVEPLSCMKCKAALIFMAAFHPLLEDGFLERIGPGPAWIALPFPLAQSPPTPIAWKGAKRMRN